MATPDQIKALVQNSDFCWQGVKYQCTDTTLDTSSSFLLDAEGQRMTGFGTAGHSNVTGCACSVLGTCQAEDSSCHCHSQGVMSDQGFVTDSHMLPVTGFNVSVAPHGSGSVTVTDVRCAPTSAVDIPKDCFEAHSWGSRHGIDYNVSGEFLISPDPVNVHPFLVYCDFHTYPGIPVTRIKPVPLDGEPVGDDDPEVSYQGPSPAQLQALVQVSSHCYQPVRVDCFAAKFMEGGVQYETVTGDKLSSWTSGNNVNNNSCTCGKERLCGGTESLSTQRATKCNCDIGDEVWRIDAAILNVGTSGPITALLTSGVFDPAHGYLNLTVGDVSCARDSLTFDECTTGFHECDPRAHCEDRGDGYRCLCPQGWQGRIVGDNGQSAMANGRQCIDDDECTLINQCEDYISDCVNTPGSYRCDCGSGYRHSEGDPVKCVDIDECKEDTDTCDENARCYNTYGHFRCRCKKGFTGSGQQGECTPVGQCFCFGDPHCSSFDGRWNHYQGQCSYVMAENNCHGQGNGSGYDFRVITRYWDRRLQLAGQYSWVKEVVVQVHNKKVVIGQGQGQGLVLTVNGQQKTTFHHLSPSNEVLLHVSIVGYQVELSTNFGLKVIADGNDEVTVILPTSYNNQTCGLCGNYNDDPTDDWIVGPQCPALHGQQTNNEVLFGNSWTADNTTCSVDCEPDIAVPTTCNNPENQVDQLCDRLFNQTSLFHTEGCLQNMTSVDRVGFQYACSFDLCHTEDMAETLCELTKVMASHCLDLLGETFNFTSDGLCEETESTPTEPTPTEPADTTLAPTTPAPTTPPSPTETESTPTELTPAETTLAPTTLAPTTSAPTTPPSPTAAPQPCNESTPCTEPHTQCQDGVCVCQTGYKADCTRCVDVDECATGGHTCTHLGQICVNTLGSYHCACQDGFFMTDGQCHDVDECKDPGTHCGHHAECLNLLGTYQCVCCMGYTKAGEVCRRDPSLDAVYGSPGQECCACTGGDCDLSEPVCGTDGETYANYAAMVVRGCRDNRTVDVSYRGYCQESCNTVQCDQPYETCSEDEVSGKATCSCPDCTGQDSHNMEPVCASNGQVYASECIFQLVMCLAGRHDVSLESSLTLCNEHEAPVTHWSEWSTCDNPCGKGTSHRTRELTHSADHSATIPSYSLHEEAACYTTCEQGPCTADTCHNPGQVCELSPSIGGATCVCPDCTGRPHSPVCAIVGDLVKTFDSECVMRQRACQLTKNYRLLSNKACEDSPPPCSLLENKASLIDAEGCHTDGQADLGFCYGRCNLEGDCCRPLQGGNGDVAGMVPLSYVCPNATTYTKQEKVVSACGCIQEPQH